MPSPFTLPPAGFGPGSQPVEEGELDYMALPSGMRTYSPRLPEVADPAAAAPALALLAALAEACDRAAAGTPASFDVSTLPPAARKLLAETLGQGEVSVMLRGIPALAMQESVFAGVWAVQGAGVARIEVAPVPAAALTAAFAPTRAARGCGPLRAGVVNAPAILTELLDAAARGPRAETHAVNLTLLPHTPEDLVWLEAALGEGACTILSRGYGNCRVTATATPLVWRVQFYNSMDVLILDSFEVTEMPEVALAAAEDLTDSAARLRDVLEAIR